MKHASRVFFIQTLKQVQVVKDKHGGDVFAMKTLKKSQTLAQESVSI